MQKRIRERPRPRLSSVYHAKEQLSLLDLLDVISTLFDMGGGMMRKIFLTTVLKRFGGGSRNFVTSNINLSSIKKVMFGSLGYPLLPWQ